MCNKSNIKKPNAFFFSLLFSLFISSPFTKSARFRPGTESSNTKTRRSQHKNHHHHYQQPQKQQDETVTAASVNHQHHLPPVIKNAIALTATTTTKKRNNNHKHLKHSGAGTVVHNKDPGFSHFPDEMNFLLSNNNNFNRINNDNDSDDDEDEDEENFAETRNNNDEDEERRERDRQKDKVQFDLPNKDYVDFDTVMQNSAPSKLRDDKSNRKRVSKNYDDEDDEDEIESGDSSEERSSNDDRDEKLKRKTTVITQFPSEIIVSAIEKEDAEIGKQQQRRQQRQEYRKGSKLLEKRHKINDEGNFLFACSFTASFLFFRKMY